MAHQEPQPKVSLWDRLLSRHKQAAATGLAIAAVNGVTGCSPGDQPAKIEAAPVAASAPATVTGEAAPAPKPSVPPVAETASPTYIPPAARAETDPIPVKPYSESDDTAPGVGADVPSGAQVDTEGNVASVAPDDVKAEIAAGKQALADSEASLPTTPEATPIQTMTYQEFDAQNSPESSLDETKQYVVIGSDGNEAYRIPARSLDPTAPKVTIVISNLPAKRIGRPAGINY